MREDVGDREEAENLYRRAADLGDTDVLFHLAVLREGASDREGADGLVHQAADHGNISVLYDLAELREEAGDRKGAEVLARLAADHGSASVLYRARWPPRPLVVGSVNPSGVDHVARPAEDSSW
ncbi:hypothetical protein [Streptomyces sp. NBC_01643]|uniref:hypothetical protein n=1 Tax=Streptomyces sp. NBC_01643 TaxID=2975906 RepID=UPI00386780EB|nr:hypothetical protein OHB03_46585 [Streptomyces sp. NBC_01643]